MEKVAALLGRYAQVLSAAWKERNTMEAAPIGSLERQFLPAALEILETPAPALPRAILWAIVCAALFGVAWSYLGSLDQVAIAQGKVIAAGKAKTVQAAETSVVKAIRIQDGQFVKAGEVLLELEVAGTQTGAEAKRLQEALTAALLEVSRQEALSSAAAGEVTSPRWSYASISAASAEVEAEKRLMDSQYQEHRGRLKGVAAEFGRKEAELNSARELVGKLEASLPITRRRAEDYKNLLQQNYVSQHGWLEREQARIEQERDLKIQQSRLTELSAALAESRAKKQSHIAEFERIALNGKLEAEKRVSQLRQELVKASARHRQQTLSAPIDGTVQQLGVHTVGGVVQASQVLMIVAPKNYVLEIEAQLENKDIGFVKPGQAVEVKVETFPFTKYGTLTGIVSSISQDAIADEKRGLMFQARVLLQKTSLNIEGKRVALSPGMNVTAEISTGRRRVLDYFLDTVKKTLNEGLRER